MTREDAERLIDRLESWCDSWINCGEVIRAQTVRDCIAIVTEFLDEQNLPAAYDPIEMGA